MASQEQDKFQDQGQKPTEDVPKPHRGVEDKEEFYADF